MIIPSISGETKMNKLKIELFKKDIEAKIKNIDIWLDENKEYFDLYRISDSETTFLHRKSFCEYSLYLVVGYEIANFSSPLDYPLQSLSTLGLTIQNTKTILQTSFIHNMHVRWS